MWEGHDTKELLDAKKQYIDKFGYNPDGELGVEYYEGIKKSIFTTLWSA